MTAEPRGTEMTVPNELVSGTLATPRFEIDSLLPLSGAAIRVQIRNETDAMNLLRHVHPEFIGPRQELGLSDDALCDAVEDAVRQWVATFPLFLVNRTPECWDAFANRPLPRCCAHKTGRLGPSNSLGFGLPARPWICRDCGQWFASDPNDIDPAPQSIEGGA